LPSSSPKQGRFLDLVGQIQAARQGSEEALAWLLEECRPYLLLLANNELDSDLRPKVGASDLVQESVLEARQGFVGFRGSTQEEWLAWLRRILLHNLADARRRYQEAARRRLCHEELLDAGNPTQLHEQLVADTPSPPERAAAREQEQALQAARARLPEDYRRVLALRYDEGRSFAEVGAALGRSEEAAKKLWLRAVRRLRREVRGEHSDD
jgi:RNA polymerase sigma-70 factor (ECF subfamily)